MLITYSSIILTMRRLFFMFLGIFIISASMSSQEIDKNILDNIPQSQIDEPVSMASKDRFSEELAELDKSNQNLLWTLLMLKIPVLILEI